MTDQVQFLRLFSILTPLVLQRETFLGKFSNLNLIVLSIEDLSLELFDLDPIRLDLSREPLDLNGLENDNKRQIVTEIGLLVVGQVLDSGFSQLFVTHVVGELSTDERSVANEGGSRAVGALGHFSVENSFHLNIIIN